MLLLLRDELRIALSPSGIDAVRLKRGLRPRIAAQSSIDCALSATAPWRGPLDALPAVLKEHPGVAGARIVLSNHYVRYLLLPWHAALTDPQELVALARARFRELHGAIADEWEVQLGLTRFGMPQLACAVDRALIDGVEQIFSQGGLRLHSVRPLLAVIYNRWRSVLTLADCWFALFEAGRLCLCRIEQGAWRSIVSVRPQPGDVAAALRILMEREMLLLPSAQSDRIYAYAAGVQPKEMSSVNNVKGFNVSVLNAQDAVGTSYAMVPA